MIQDFSEGMFRVLTKAPLGEVYPNFFDVRGICLKDPNSSPRINIHNISFIVDMIVGLQVQLAREKKCVLQNSQIGIASPYAAQARATRRALNKAGLHGVKVGVTESWQGDGRDLMFVDLVRAKNPDMGDLGFLCRKERLNVLLSRQKQFLFVVGDMKCCEFASDPATAADTATVVEPGQDWTEDNEKKIWGPNEQKNKWVKKVLGWFTEKGRVVEVPLDVLTEDYIMFSKEEEEEEEEEEAKGWEDEEQPGVDMGEDEEKGQEDQGPAWVEQPQYEGQGTSVW